MLIKIRDIFRTSYIYDTFVKDLEYIVSTDKRLREDSTITYNVGAPILEQFYEDAKAGVPNSFDLADCRITPEVADFIKRNYTYVWCDSADAKRDQILRLNHDRYTMPHDDTDMPPIDFTKRYLDYYYNLSIVDVYNPSSLLKCFSGDEQAVHSLIILALAANPDIKVNLTTMFFSIAKLINNFVDINNYTSDDYWFVTPNFAIEVHGDYAVYGTDAKNKDELQNYGYLVPYDFGTKCLKKDERWTRLFQKCAAYLKKYKIDDTIGLLDMLKTLEVTNG